MTEAPNNKTPTVLALVRIIGSKVEAAFQQNQYFLERTKERFIFEIGAG